MPLSNIGLVEFYVTENGMDEPVRPVIDGLTDV